MRCVGDDSSHLLFSEVNLNYHPLHTYTTGMHTTHLEHILNMHKHILFYCSVMSSVSLFCNVILHGLYSCIQTITKTNLKKLATTDFFLIFYTGFFLLIADLVCNVFICYCNLQLFSHSVIAFLPLV